MLWRYGKEVRTKPKPIASLLATDSTSNETQNHSMKTPLPDSGIVNDSGEEEINRKKSQPSTGEDESFDGKNLTNICRKRRKYSNTSHTEISHLEE